MIPSYTGGQVEEQQFGTAKDYTRAFQQVLAEGIPEHHRASFGRRSSQLAALGSAPPRKTAK